MARESISRRRVLGSIATGAIGTAALGNASGKSGTRHIVGTSSVAATEAAKSHATVVRHELDFGSVGKAIAGDFPEEALDGLRNRPDVRYVERDGKVEALGETLPWGIDRVDADVAHANGETGNGADISIIDSGIDSDHPDLQANLGTGYAVVNCSGCAEPWDDDHSHGTHCAGIADAVDNTTGVIGVSSDATLHAVKVFDSESYASVSDLSEGIRWVADQGHDVGSMSLGATSSYSTLRDACQYAYDNGVLLVAAAGNDGACSDCVRYPAAYSTVIAVSATTSDDDLASFSSTGPEVELAAPGSAIYSTVPDGYSSKSGTSMATPHVAGAAGLVMANGYSNTEARDRLQQTAEDIGLSSNEQGHGLVDAEAAVGGSSGNDTSVAVSTGDATNVGEKGATLNGSLTDLGGASSADVSFEYRESGASSWTTTTTQTLSSTGTFSQDVSALSSGTEYEFRAVGDASDGDTDTGSTITFTTSTDPSVAVSTVDATSVGETTATLNGDLTDLGGASSATVSFEYRESGASSWSATNGQSLSSTGPFSTDVSGLTSGTDYEFRAVADASDGDSDAGAALSFTTNSSSSGSTAPVVDRYSVSEAGSPNPHAEITADWAVSDADADLSAVTVEVADSSGAVVDSARTNVSGGSASGTDQFKLKHAGHATFDVQLTVTDSTGNTASQVTTVTS